MTTADPRGLVYRCPVCGAEIAIIALKIGAFSPRCCNRPMVPRSRHLVFYLCEICGIEVAVLAEGDGAFTPVCCNEAMKRLPAAA